MNLQKVKIAWRRWTGEGNTYGKKIRSFESHPLEELRSKPLLWHYLMHLQGKDYMARAWYLKAWNETERYQKIVHKGHPLRKFAI